MVSCSRMNQDVGSDSLCRASFRLVTVASVGVMLLAFLYQFVPLTRWLAVLVLAVCVALWIGLARREKGTSRACRPIFRPDFGLLFLAVGAFADAAILFLFVAARTTDAIVSPWSAFGFEPFALFFLATAAHVVGARMRSDRVSIAFAVWHAFVAFGVSAAMYGVGFGFDPFLHRAAEEELASLGSIEPRQLLYSGQYVLVAAMHLVSGIPVRWIDVWSVPLFAAMTWPVGTYLGLRYGWGLSDRDARTWWIVVLVQPFMLATFTVPFTWTYAWFVPFLFVLPLVGQSASVRRALMLGTSAMCLFHPLLAGPTLAALVGYAVWSRASGTPFRTAALLASALLVAVSAPALFAVYQHRQGIPVDLSFLMSEAGRFLSLFRSPFWDPYPYIPWFLQLIYGFRYWFPMLFFAVGSVAFVILALRPAFRFSWYYLAVALGLLGAVYGTATLFFFRDIIDHEQSEFALRLLTVVFLLPLPAFAVLSARMTSGRPRLAAGMLAVVCALATHAWFFSYPQYNLKYPFFSPSVSADDIEAVHAIDEDADGKTYLVLSNQMTSAAAIQEFHFRSYVSVDGEQALWYAIPTGGPLYAYYSRAVYSGPTRALFDELRARTSVDRVYFVIHDYWPWYPGFVEELERGADGTIVVRDGSVRIYVYSYEEE